MNNFANYYCDYIGSIGESPINDYIRITSNTLNDKINNISFENINSNITDLRNETYHINSNNPDKLIDYNYNDYNQYNAIHTNIYINQNINSKLIFRPRYNNQAASHKLEIRNDGRLYVYLQGNLIPPIAGGWYCLNDELQNIFIVNTGQDTALTTIGSDIIAINSTLLAHGTKLAALTILDTATGSYTIITAQLDNFALWQYAVGGIVGTIGIAGAYTAATANRAGNLADMINASFVSSNALNELLRNTTITAAEKIALSNQIQDIRSSNRNLLTSNFFELGVNQGFLNCNSSFQQFIPSLKSDKIILGNITTPNSSYQMEMTGDLNLNQLYLNSTSLTSLLNQKQNNLTPVSPLYLTTGNIGLNYDSSLTKIGNNLSVVKTATAPLNWTGNDISLNFNNTLINNSGSLSVAVDSDSKWRFSGTNIYNKTLGNVGIGTNSSLMSKLNVIGDIYCSSNINIGVSSNLIDFNGSFSNVAVNGITTDDEKERYLIYLSDGSLTLHEVSTADILMVGAGGYGGIGSGSGGGGAGEVIYYPNFPLPKATMNIQVGYVDPNSSLRRSRIYIPSGNTIITANGGGNGGTSHLYSTSGSGTVSSITAVSGSSTDYYLSFTSGTTTLTLNSSLSCDILVVGGGGGGGISLGSGGGAGGVVYITNYTLNVGSYTITVGAGGSPMSTNGDSTTPNGGNSIINNGTIDIITALGGARGNGQSSGVITRSGGCGAGGVRNYTTGGSGTQTTDGTISAISRTNGYGYAGGTGNNPYPFMSGGGGGAGGVGGNSTSTNAGNGGIGIQVNITGTNTYYAGGGGGGAWDGAAGTVAGNGGLGGGGNGCRGNTNASNGTANTGGGGGGRGGTDSGVGGTGGSGIVIIRFRNYTTIINPTSGGSGGGGAINKTGAAAGVKFDDYKSYVQAGLNGTSTTGGNGGSGSSLYNTRYTTNITGTPISVGLGGSGVSSSSPAAPATKSNYGDGGDGNGGSGFQGVVIIRFKKSSTNLNLRTIKDNANTGLILNANETSTAHQLRIFPWSDTYTTTGIPTRGWSFRTYDGLANGNDLISLFSYFGGRVGIKEKNPASTLDINGDLRCKTFNTIGNEQYGISCQIVNEHSTGQSSMNVFAGTGTNYGGFSIAYLPSQNLGYISCSKNLQIKTGNDAANSYIQINDANGYVGIGITNPASKLGVNGMITANDCQINNGLNAGIISSGQLYSTGIDTNLLNNLNGTITNVNNLFASNIYINNTIDMNNKNILNVNYLYGTANAANEWKAFTNYYHKDDQGRDRIYFKNDTTGSPPNHFTLFKSGGTTHTFADKDDVQYCLIERFGLTTYFEVISGSGYDNVGVADGVSTGTYVFRKMYLRLSTFTEVHRCFCEDELYTNYNDFINEFVGRIVISKGKIKTALKQPDEPWKILEGKNGITIDDSHPTVELSRKANDKRVIGVITKRENSKDMENRLVINSLGETAVWVVNSSSNIIRNGDLITSSDEIGYGQLQLDSNGMPDEIIRNFTLGKSMIDCNFELDSSEYKCEIIDESSNLRRAFLPIFVYSG